MSRGISGGSSARMSATRLNRKRGTMTPALHHFIAFLFWLKTATCLGLPVRWLLGACRPLAKEQWISIPFAGITSLIIVLQNLVYANIPIRLSTPWIWLALGVTWATLLCNRSFRASLSTFPHGIFIV